MLKFSTTNVEVLRGRYESTNNGLTSRFDTLPLIFVGTTEDRREPQVHAVEAFAAKLGHTDFLVAVDRLAVSAPKITPAAHFLRHVEGVAVAGGNEVVIEGQRFDAHDRLETWAQYRSLSI